MPVEICARCRHARGQHDAGVGPCQMGTRSGEGCACGRFMPSEIGLAEWQCLRLDVDELMHDRQCEHATFRRVWGRLRWLLIGR